MGMFASSMGGEAAVWNVSDINIYIREMFDVDYRLQDVEVEGEISNFTRARSGHLYFTLKDDRSQLKCVMWRTAADRLRFEPADGEAIIARGRISVYEAGGVYQLYTEQMRPLGRGNLALAFEQLKEKLASEGLFAPERKKTLPDLPAKIGIVTSLDAAGLQDILKVLERRYPIGQVLIAPTLVQGQEAPAQIVRALQWLDGRDDVDVIIVARGGGSIEDLWAFNEEGVARAISVARTPIISGIGHEIDFTIADFVADVRAPTPSAAAELVAPDLSKLAENLSGTQMFLRELIESILADALIKVQNLVRQLHLLSPRSQLNSSRQTLDLFIGRLDTAIGRHLDRAGRGVDVMEARLAAVNPLATLARGYALIRDEAGEIIRTAKALTPDKSIEIQLADGRRPAVILNKRMDDSP